MKNSSLVAKKACVHCFKSLGVPAKYEIYKYLVKTPKATVSELVKLVGLTQPTVSYHLKDMAENGLLHSEKVGKEVFYSLDKNCPHYDDECVLSNLRFRE